MLSENRLQNTPHAILYNVTICTKQFGSLFLLLICNTLNHLCVFLHINKTIRGKLPLSHTKFDILLENL